MFILHNKHRVLDSEMLPLSGLENAVCPVCCAVRSLKVTVSNIEMLVVLFFQGQTCAVLADPGRRGKNLGQSQSLTIGEPKIGK